MSSVLSPLPRCPASSSQHHSEFHNIHRHGLSAPAGLSVLANAAPSAFPRTLHLLSCVLSGLLRDDLQYVLRMYDLVFIRIWNNLLWPSDKAEQEKLASVFEPNSPSVKEFFDREGGFPVGIVSCIEQPSSGRIIWGVTNDQEAHKDELGWQIPVLNAKLCAEYELTFQEEEEISSAESAVEPTHPSLELAAIRARRAQLGSLIAITFTHEGMHAYLRWKLGDSVDAAVFNTPQVIPDYGMTLESRLFRGSVQIQIAEEDSKATDRLRRIQNIWLKVDVQKQKDPAPAFRLIRENYFLHRHYNLYN